MKTKPARIDPKPMIAPGTLTAMDVFRAEHPDHGCGGMYGTEQCRKQHFNCRACPLFVKRPMGDRPSEVESLLRRAQGEIDSAIILDDDEKNAGDGQAAWVVVPLLQALSLLADEIREIKRGK